MYELILLHLFCVSSQGLRVNYGSVLMHLSFPKSHFCWNFWTSCHSLCGNMYTSLIWALHGNRQCRRTLLPGQDTNGATSLIMGEVSWLECGGESWDAVNSWPALLLHEGTPKLLLSACHCVHTRVFSFGGWVHVEGGWTLELINFLFVYKPYRFC